MEQMELAILNPTDGNFLKKISWNREEIEKAVRQITQQYEGLTYTDEQMAAAKKDRATLNSLKKAISDRRIEVKKALLAPYDVFEAEVKEIIALIDKPIAMIDKQTSAYEEKLKEDKRQELIDFFKENVGELEGMLTFDMIFSQRWLNKTASIKSCKEEITAAIERTETDLRAIETMIEEKYRPYAKDYYFRSLNMTAVLNEVVRLRAIDRMAEEEKAAREEAEKLRREQEAAEKEAAINPPTEPESVQNPPESVQKPEESVHKQPESASSPAAQVTDPFADKDTDTKIYKASFTIRGTKAQILSVKEFMINNNIQFGKVEK